MKFETQISTDFKQIITDSKNLFVIICSGACNYLCDEKYYEI